MIKAAGMLLAEPKSSDTLKWGTAKVQLALRAVTTVLEHMIGPCMGLGCPDRAAAIHGRSPHYTLVYLNITRKCMSDSVSVATRGPILIVSQSLCE